MHVVLSLVEIKRKRTRKVLTHSYATSVFQYMRVDDKCDMDKVWSVLTECWQLPKPRMLISVTGGAKRFYLRPRLKNILKQGLVNAAVSTGNLEMAFN